MQTAQRMQTARRSATVAARAQARAACVGAEAWGGWEVEPARTASRRPEARLAVVPGSGGAVEHRRLSELPELLRAGDVVVINDAGTLPASVSGRVEGSGAAVELRLAASLDTRHAALERWVAAVLGEGSWREPTERRAAPPRLEVGDVVCAGRLRARVEAVRDAGGRLVEVRLEAADGDLWGALYAEGRPVQYAYHREALAVWDQQTPFAGAPVAVEPPSSGFHLTWGLVGRLREAGVEVVPITHGTGLSTLGDAALDALLPLPERTYIGAASAARIGQARGEGRRVVAVGTGVVRALESAAGDGGAVASGWMTALVRLGPGVEVRVVDGLLTGLHAPNTSHGRLLASLVGMGQVERSWEAVSRAGYAGHEYGDMALVWRVQPGRRAAR